MKTKLHFGIVIALLIFLGRFLDAATVPNQQIVIQFSNEQLFESSNEEALRSIKQKLKSLGISDIQVAKNDGGQLKITYFSKADINVIKTILFSGNEVSFERNNGPSNHGTDSDAPEHYELSVSEITKPNSSDSWDFEAVEVLEVNHKTDRFTNAEFDLSVATFDFNHANCKINHRLKTFDIYLVTKSNFTFNIPEVRAGPLS